MNNVIKVLLVDDHTIMRDGIAAILNQMEDIRVVGSLSSGEEAISQFQLYKPDVIMMDIVMSGMTGLEATRWIKEQDKDVKIIIMSSEVKKDLVTTGIKCGIDGYLPKDISKEGLVDSIRRVNNGEKYFNDAITSLIFEDFYEKETMEPKQKRTVSSELTRRENEVLEIASLGKSNQEIADTLFISIKTVETHKKNILDKLGLKNTAQLVRYAIKNNIISIDEPF